MIWVRLVKTKRKEKGQSEGRFGRFRFLSSLFSFQVPNSPFPLVSQRLPASLLIYFNDTWLLLEYLPQWLNQNATATKANPFCLVLRGNQTAMYPMLAQQSLHNLNLWYLFSSSCKYPLSRVPSLPQIIIALFLKFFPNATPETEHLACQESKKAILLTRLPTLADPTPCHPSRNSFVDEYNPPANTVSWLVSFQPLFMKCQELCLSGVVYEMMSKVICVADSLLMETDIKQIGTRINI